MKKVKIIFCAGIAFLLLGSIVTGYFIFWRSPVVDRVEYLLNQQIHYQRWLGGVDEWMEAMRCHEAYAKDDGDPGYQWIGIFDTLPSENAEDYMGVQCQMYYRNPTAVRQYINRVQVNNFDLSAEMLVISNFVWTEQADPNSEGYLNVGLLLYTAGKTEQEIKDVLRSVEWQLTFDTKLRKGATMYCRSSDAEFREYDPLDFITDEEIP